MTTKKTMKLTATNSVEKIDGKWMSVWVGETETGEHIKCYVALIKKTGYPQINQ